MDIVDRIKIVMKSQQLNAAGFADEIGVQRANVSHVLTGRNKPSLDFIERILLQYPRVNAAWLISGKIQDEKQTDTLSDAKPAPAPAPEASGSAQSELFENKQLQSDLANKTTEKETAPEGSSYPTSIADKGKEVSDETPYKPYTATKKVDTDLPNESTRSVSEGASQAESYRGMANPSKRLSRIVLFYEDNTFDSYIQNEG